MHTYIHTYIHYIHTHYSPVALINTSLIANLNSCMFCQQSALTTSMYVSGSQSSMYLCLTKTYKSVCFGGCQSPYPKSLFSLIVREGTSRSPARLQTRMYVCMYVCLSSKPSTCMYVLNLRLLSMYVCFRQLGVYVCLINTRFAKASKVH